MNRNKYLFNPREIKLKSVINPSQYLIPSYKVRAVHHSYIGRHWNSLKQFSLTHTQTHRDRERERERERGRENMEDKKNED